MEVFSNTFINTNNVEVKLHDNIVIGGMGGSGISGTYVKSIFESLQLSKRITVVRDYKFIRILPDSSYILVSYSGNTEETISLFNQLLSNQVKPIIVTSGGKLLELAKSHTCVYYILESGLQPRMAFPNIFSVLLKILHNSFKDKMQIDHVEIKKLTIPDNIKEIKFSNFSNNLPIIITNSDYACVGERLRCQLNENAKLHSFNFVLPEYHHNGLVGLKSTFEGKIYFIFIEQRTDLDRIKFHFKFLKQKLIEKNIQYIEVYCNSDSYYINLLQLTMIVDYISLVIAKHQGINPIEVELIDQLKVYLKTMV